MDKCSPKSDRRSWTLQHWIGRICSNSFATVCGIGWLAFVVAAAVSWFVPFVPAVHDEFSYLLAADTLLHGRLSNPSPEVWQPFQSFHILVEPSYASKYPLGPSALIALGWAVFGLPISGCWLSAALCASSLTWMLSGLTNRRWALGGGLLVALHPAMQVVWSQTLMSGWLTAAGSGLLAGSILRLRRRLDGSAAILGGLGIAVLALTRPFEGCIATLLAAAALWSMWLPRLGFTKTLANALQAFCWMSLPVAVAAGLIAAQNVAITGDFKCMPYQVHEQTYAQAPLFVFGQPRIPKLSSEDLPIAISEFQSGWALQCFEQRAGWLGWLIGIPIAIQTLLGFWSPWALLPVLTSPFWLRIRVAREFAWMLIGQLAASASVCWIFPHYLAPALPWMIILGVIGLRVGSRVLHVGRRGSVRRSNSKLALMGLVTAQVILLIANTFAASNSHERDWAHRRAEIAEGLSAKGGKHLVLVQYGPSHNVHEEWVYNLSDLNSERVIWARGERAHWNARLIQAYTAERTIWQLLVTPGADAKLGLLSRATQQQTGTINSAEKLLETPMED